MRVRVPQPALDAPCHPLSSVNDRRSSDDVRGGKHMSTPSSQEPSRYVPDGTPGPPGQAPLPGQLGYPGQAGVGPAPEPVPSAYGYGYGYPPAPPATTSTVAIVAL